MAKLTKEEQSQLRDALWRVTSESAIRDVRPTDLWQFPGWCGRLLSDLDAAERRLSEVMTENGQLGEEIEALTRQRAGAHRRALEDAMVAVQGYTLQGVTQTQYDGDIPYCYRAEDKILRLMEAPCSD